MKGFIQVTNRYPTGGERKVLLNVNAIKFIELEPYDSKGYYTVDLAPGAVYVSRDDVNRILAELDK